MVWHVRIGVAIVHNGRSGCLGVGVLSRLFGRLLILITDVLGGSGATRGWFRRFLVAVFYIQLLVTTDGRVGESHELVQHSEFKLQFDAVDHRLQCSFDLVDVRVLHGKQAHIHPNYNQIYPYELCHHFSSPTMIDRLEESYGRVYVDTGDDEFLRTERGHLEFLHNVEYVNVFVILRRV